MLPISKSLSEQDNQRLFELEQYIENARNNFLGYPVSKDFDYSEINHFLQYPINNLGDPFEVSVFLNVIENLMVSQIKFLLYNLCYTQICLMRNQHINI